MPAILTDSEVVQWGVNAESLLNNPDYNALYDKIKMDLALEILATNITEREFREQLFQTYDGMRAFATRLVNMVESKNAVLTRIDRDNGLEPDFED